MSEASKNARAAMRAKAKRLSSSSGPEKVDASSWTPSAPMKANKKTGMRPVSPRTYKYGGKIQGDRGPKRSDKSPRGNLANEISTRDTKQANRDKFGSPHIGGMKKGGKAKRADGGEIPVKQIDTMGASPAEIVRARPPRESNPRPSSNGQGPSMGGRVAGSYGGKGDWKRGGKAKRADGGTAYEGMTDRTPYEDAPPPRRAIPGDAPTRGPDPKGGGRATGPKYDSIDALIKDKGLKKGGKARKAEGGAMGRRINDTLNDNRSHKEYGYEIDAERRAPRALSPPFIRDRTDRSDPRALRDLQRGDADAMIGVNSRESGYKKGGKAHSDAAQDRAMIKKMVRPAAIKRDAKCGGGRMANGGSVAGGERPTGARIPRARGGNASTYADKDDAPRLRLMKTHTDGNKTAKVYKDADFGEYRVKHYVDGKHQTKADYHTDDVSDANSTAGSFLRSQRASGGRTRKNDGGGLDSYNMRALEKRSQYGAPSNSLANQARVQARIGEKGLVRTLDENERTERASGGRTKGKTNINIIVNPNKAGDDQQMQPSGPIRPPPPPVMTPPAPPPGGPPPGMPPNMPPPSMAGGPPPGMPPGMPPMRARGGRLGMNRIGGSGGGLGRLEKANLR